MYIKRKIESEILKYLKTSEILAVIGPRQAGKTTILKNIQDGLKNSIFLSFEDRDDLELFEQDVKGFAKKYKSYDYIFIDEFQYAKQGGKNLKYLFDSYQGRGKKNKIIISGSSALDLTVRAIKFLVGRIFVFNLYQFDFEEFLSFRDADLHRVYLDFKKDFNLEKQKITQIQISRTFNQQFNQYLKEFILWGGYPRVVLAPNEDEKKTVLKNIYNTYFLRDIKDVLGLIDDFKLSKLIKALAIQIGQLVEYNELSRLSEYDYLSLKKYLNILNKTFICEQVRPFFKNKRTEITKNPKVYFFDTGLRNHVINDFNILDNRVDKGFLYENFVFNQLLKQDLSVNFWRTKAKAEIDFVMPLGQENIPIESKSELNKLTTTKSLSSFIEQYKPARAIFLSNNKLGQIKKNKTKIYFLPQWII